MTEARANNKGEFRQHKSALFRADGSLHLGIGHIMRCLAFAQGLGKIGVKPIFVIRDYEQKITELIQHYGYDVETIAQDSSLSEDALLTSEFASRYNVNLIITDLSHADNMANLDEYNRYFPVLRTADKFMVSIDDPIKTNFPHDIQIIPYYGAENMNYKSYGGTKLLLGPAYFIFSQGFTEAAKVNRAMRKDAQNILVAMSGSDPFKLTLKVAKVLNKLKVNFLNLRSVIGPGFATAIKPELERTLKGFQGNHEIIIESDNMPDLMLWSDLAITGGGLTKYETAVTGTPSIIISHSDLGAARTKEFEKGGSALHLGPISEINEDDIVEAVEKLLGDDSLRAEMSRRGRNMVDGKGLERIISEIPRSVLS